MTIIVPARKVLGRQPQSALQINRNNPLGQHLVALINNGMMMDCVNNNPVSIVGSIDKFNINNYITTGAASEGGANTVVAGPADVGTGNLTDFCIIEGAPQYSSGSIYRYACGTYDAVTGTGIFITHSTASYNWGAADVGSNLANSIASASEKVPTTGLQFLVHTRDGSNHRLYRNAVLKATRAGTNGNSSASPFCQNSLNTSVIFSTTGKISLSGRFNKALSADEIASLYENPWQIFAPRRQLLYVSATSVQLSYLRPSSDITTGSWSPSTGTTLYGVLDEVTADDADYIQAATATGCEIKLSAGSTPTSRDNHTIKYRLLAGSGNIAVVLKCGSTTIKSWNHVLTGSAQDFSQALSNAEATNITDYSDLRVTFTSS
jgi:hypothetical protein